jgi:hypoxanthine phosphoribosyltransferase
MDFLQFDAQVRHVSDRIAADGFKPDAIVAVARGGWIPARLFSKYLGVKKLFSCGMTYADATRVTTVTYQPVTLAPETRAILVVEDFLESGKSIKQVVDTLQAQGADARSACLGYLEKTLVMPTYSLGAMREVPIFPWD